MEMLCTAFATPMHWSIAISSVSYTSFQRITSMGSGVPAKSAPTASWYSASPSSSNRNLDNP